MSVSVCSTLSGKVALKHPESGVLVREDGAVFMVLKGWSYGKETVKGYMRLHIGNKFYYVHRLIAETFLPNPDHKPTVDHINLDKHDNMVSNLRWATLLEQSHNTKKWRLYDEIGIHAPGAYHEYYKTYRRIYMRKRRALAKQSRGSSDFIKEE